MTDESWAGWYRDRQGSDAVILTTDGQQLRLRVRGVDFEGGSFDGLRPVAAGPAEQGLFALTDGVLGDCVLEWDLPFPLMAEGVERQATLSCLLSLRRPDPYLYLELRFGGAAFGSQRAESDFGSALATIQRELPPGVHLRTCIACAFSDYFPAPDRGRGLSGGLACFRGRGIIGSIFGFSASRAHGEAKFPWYGVEQRGIEPRTSALRTRRSPS